MGSFLRKKTDRAKKKNNLMFHLLVNCNFWPFDFFGASDVQWVAFSEKRRIGQKRKRTDGKNTESLLIFLKSE
jgi:hypothetical protein